MRRATALLAALALPAAGLATIVPAVPVGDLHSGTMGCLQRELDAFCGTQRPSSVARRVNGHWLCFAAVRRDRWLAQCVNDALPAGAGHACPAGSLASWHESFDGPLRTVIDEARWCSDSRFLGDAGMRTTARVGSPPGDAPGGDDEASRAALLAVILAVTSCCCCGICAGLLWRRRRKQQEDQAALEMK